MPSEPRRRSVLKHAGTTGAAATGLGLLGGAPAAAARDTGKISSAKASAHKPLDIVIFGDADSEAAHRLGPTLSDPVTGGLGRSARILKPADPAAYWGGTPKFDVAVSSVGTIYVTVRLWGDEYDSSAQEAGFGSENWRLQLFCVGLQVGCQDEGAVDGLDILETSPRTPGRFPHRPVLHPAQGRGPGRAPGPEDAYHSRPAGAGGRT
ncbi:hypothetical protein [Streptomyces phaeochromogenes]|uniref:hypothetical protein n=1 Tax=Streptomyces phaeochromogenes TaxID=1923 RepID=UPI002DD9709E|nr:hypothetical protein [Streptomyces phaeochromogenes]WRZ34676.1 hypothetical protein OG931_46560 [Streptomyces phaeochromogenes]